MTAYKQRVVDPTKRVQVYKNLHKNMFSVCQGGKVIFHCKHLVLRDCKYLVGDAGNKKVRETGVKNVHARISGFLSTRTKLECNSSPLDEFPLWVEVRYNPYKYKQFATCDGDPVFKSSWAMMDIGTKTTVVGVWD
jgi:hypothetical protein